jgi:uncharacterized membrane protein YphA (DoxX/SURF4 family)
MRLRELPTRLATGAYILHSGLQKRRGTPEMAQGMHGMASGAYPFLGSMEPATFLRRLSMAEMAVGGLLLAPFVPTAVAGAAPTVFSGGFVTMYLCTPALRKPGSIWPSQQGMAISKDSWMLGIGLGLLADALVDRRVGRD